MIPFDVVTGTDDMVCNSGGVTILCKSFEMLGVPVMKTSFGFTDIEGITLPTTSFRSLGATEPISARKERLNPKIDKSIKPTDTRFNTSR